MDTDLYTGIFGIIEEGIKLRRPGNFTVQKLHNGLFRAVQYWGYTPDEMLDLSLDIAGAVDVTSSNTIGDSAFAYLRGLRHQQGHYSPQERYTRPTEGTTEWEVDQDMLYEIYAPWMVTRHFSYRNAPLLDVIAKWLGMATTQDLIDICNGILVAHERGYVNKRMYLWNLARRPEFRYHWDEVLIDTIRMLKANHCWEGRDAPDIRKEKKAKKSAGRRKADQS